MSPIVGVAASALIAAAAAAVAMTADRDFDNPAGLALLLFGPAAIAAIVALVRRQRRTFSSAALAAVLATGLMLGAGNASGDLDSYRAVVFLGTSVAVVATSGMGAVVVGIAINLWPRPPA